MNERFERSDLTEMASGEIDPTVFTEIHDLFQKNLEVNDDEPGAWAEEYRLADSLELDTFYQITDDGERWGTASYSHRHEDGRKWRTMYVFRESPGNQVTLDKFIFADTQAVYLMNQMTYDSTEHTKIDIQIQELRESQGCEMIDLARRMRTYNANELDAYELRVLLQAAVDSFE